MPRRRTTGGQAHPLMPAHPGPVPASWDTLPIRQLTGSFVISALAPSRNGPGVWVCYARSGRCQEHGSKHRGWCHPFAGLSHTLPSHYKDSTVSDYQMKVV